MYLRQCSILIEISRSLRIFYIYKLHQCFRAHNGPVVIASPSGGTDIENVAEKTPDLIKTIPINIYDGITDPIAHEIASFLEFRDDLRPKVILFVRYNKLLF